MTAVQELVAGFIGTFKDFPPGQKPAKFNVDTSSIIFVVDDDEFVRDALSSLLKSARFKFDAIKLVLG